MEALDAQATEPPETISMTKVPWAKFRAATNAAPCRIAKAWEELVASGEAYAAVLEDDVVLTPSAARFLKDADWIPADVALVKLEHYGPPSQSVLLSDFQDCGRRLSASPACIRAIPARRPISCRRAAAQRLLAVTPLHPAGGSSAVQSQQFAACSRRLRPGNCCRRWRGSRISSAGNPISKAGAWACANSAHLCQARTDPLRL